MEFEQGYWLNDDSRTYLERGYLQPGQTAEERIREICVAAESYLKFEGFADKFEQYILNGWISLSSPVWANFGTDRGLPISCNGSYIRDDVVSILNKTAEIGMMTKMGAGTSAYYGAVRPRGSPIATGGTTSGPVHFMELLDVTTNVISQSTVRRGQCAVYLPVEHPDIEEFLQIREEGNTIQNLSIGVCVSDAFMNDIIEGDEKKRKLWAKIIQKRFETGYPYIFFTDNVNNKSPNVYQGNGIKIYASNLCSEICLPSNENESFVCCLSSLNLLHYEEWKETDVVESLTYFLDAVMEEYIQKTKEMPFMEAAHSFAKRHRAIGIGVLGWHSYLQRYMIPFESMDAKFKNVEIHKKIQDKTSSASALLADFFGEPEVLKGYGRRNATLLAIAPTTSSSFILGQVSPSIEPLNSNYFTKDLSKGKFTYKNPFLEELLESKGKNNKATWDDILLRGGSVQHLEFLSQEEKDVFKTFGEISQKEIIIQAAQRQKYIDQSQSLNLMIHHDTPPKDVSDLMIEAWRLGVKTLYYQRSTNPAQELARSIMSCKACES